MRIFSRAFVSIACLLASSGSWAQLTVGPDDFRITNAGTDGSTDYFASRQELAFNVIDDEFLAVYLSRTNAPGLDPTEIEVWSQRISLAGAPIGPAQRITDVDGLGAPGASPNKPTVTHNPATNTYLVVYGATDPDFGVSINHIFGQVLDNSGAPQGNAFKISDLTGTDVGAFDPQVVYNFRERQLLVVWTGGSAPIRIYGELIDADSLATEVDDFLISQAPAFAASPGVAFDGFRNQYFVAWRGGPIMYQLVDPNGATLLTSDGSIGSAGFSDGLRAVYNQVHGEYLLVWGSNDPAFGIASTNFELFGRRISATGNALGTAPFRISNSNNFDQENGGAANRDGDQVARPGLAFLLSDSGYAVSWSGTTLQLNTNQLEAFVRFLPGGKDPIDENQQFAVSDAGGNEVGFFATHADIAAHDEGFLTVWWGDNNRDGGVMGENEIWGQLVNTDFLMRSNFDPLANASDRRLKFDVHPVGKTQAGLQLYRFRYHQSPEQIWVGVMAQDILKIHPAAVTLHADGYYRVDYNQLGIAMKSWAEWSKSR